MVLLVSSAQQRWAIRPRGTCEFPWQPSSCSCPGWYSLVCVVAMINNIEALAHIKKLLESVRHHIHQPPYQLPSNNKGHVHLMQVPLPLPLHCMCVPTGPKRCFPSYAAVAWMVGWLASKHTCSSAGAICETWLVPCRTRSSSSSRMDIRCRCRWILMPCTLSLSGYLCMP